MKVSIFLCFFQDSFPFLHWTFNIPFYFLHPFTHNTVPNIPFYHPVFHTTPKQLTKRGNKKETRDLQDGGRVRLRDHLSPHKYIRNTSTCGTIPTEHLLNAGRRPQNFPKGKKLPMYLGRAKEKKKKQSQKKRDGTWTTGKELWRRKRFHTLGSPFTGGGGGWQGGSFRATEESTATGVQRAKRRDSPTEDQCQPALTSPRVLSAHPPAGTGWGWELRLGLRRSDPRERTGVGCMNTAWWGLVQHSRPGGSPGKRLDLPNRQETIVSGCARRRDAEHYLKEFQGRARGAAISMDPRDGHETLRLLLQPPRSLCVSTGHYPHLPSWEPVQPTTARVPWSRDNFPGRTHGRPRPIATACRPLPPQARIIIHTPPSPPAWVRQRLLISCYFNPDLSKRRTDTLRQPTRRAGAKSKAEAQELCEKRREREISPSSLRSSRLNLHNQLDVPCICGIPE